MTTIRKAGARWRFLAHRRDGDSPIDISHDQFAPSEFDELVVGKWCHIEQMDTGTWWMNIGGVTIWLTANRDGKPKQVTVFGPLDYGHPEPGCKYECTWTDVPG